MATSTFVVDENNNTAPSGKYIMKDDGTVVLQKES